MNFPEGYRGLSSDFLRSRGLSVLLGNYRVISDSAESDWIKSKQETVYSRETEYAFSTNSPHTGRSVGRFVLDVHAVVLPPYD